MKFEQYLQEIHAKDYQGLDDDMPDAFDDWLANDLCVTEIIHYAEMWSKDETMRCLDRMKDRVGKIIPIQFEGMR